MSVTKRYTFTLLGPLIRKPNPGPKPELPHKPQFAARATARSPAKRKIISLADQEQICSEEVMSIDSSGNGNMKR